MRLNMKPSRLRLWSLHIVMLLLPVLASNVMAQLRFESVAAEPLRAVWLLPDSSPLPTQLEVLPPAFPLAPAAAVFLSRLQVELLPNRAGAQLTHPYALPFEPVPVRVQFMLDGQWLEQQWVLDERDLVRPSVEVNWGDTLWAIALAARPNDRLTPQQVMLAIQDLNPEAFLRENINWVLAEAELRLPTAAEIQVRSVAAAIAEVRRQNEAFYAWQSARVAAADTVPAEPNGPGAEAAERDPDGFLEVLGVPESSVTELSAEPTLAVLSVLRDELTLQREMKVALERQMRVHQDRLSALDAQMKTLTELVSLERAAAAQLQATAAELIVNAAPPASAQSTDETLPVVAQPRQNSPNVVRPDAMQWLQHGLWILGLVILVWLSVVFWRWRQVWRAESITASAQARSEPMSAPAIIPEPEPEPEPELTSHVADPTQIQLELAEQYVKLGDLAAAQDLLQQVVAQGTAEQQTAAQLLLDRLQSNS